MIRKAIALLLLPTLSISTMAVIALVLFFLTGLIQGLASLQLGKIIPSLVLALVSLVFSLGIWAGWEFVRVHFFSIPSGFPRKAVTFGLIVGVCSGFSVMLMAGTVLSYGGGVVWNCMLIGYASYVAALFGWVSPNNSLKADGPDGPPP